MIEDTEFEYLYEEGISTGVKVTVPDFGKRYKNGTIFSLDNLSIGDVGWSITVRKLDNESDAGPEGKTYSLFPDHCMPSIYLILYIRPISNAEIFERKTKMQIKVRTPGPTNMTIWGVPSFLQGIRIHDEDTSHIFENDGFYATFVSATMSAANNFLSETSEFRFFFKFNVYEKYEEDIWIPS